jgi:hypothetical protein
VLLPLGTNKIASWIGTTNKAGGKLFSLFITTNKTEEGGNLPTRKEKQSRGRMSKFEYHFDVVIEVHFPEYVSSRLMKVLPATTGPIKCPVLARSEAEAILKAKQDEIFNHYEFTGKVTVYGPDKWAIERKHREFKPDFNEETDVDYLADLSEFCRTEFENNQLDLLGEFNTP